MRRAETIRIVTLEQLKEGYVVLDGATMICHPYLVVGKTADVNYVVEEPAPHARAKEDRRG
jgi:hypothetical protein